MRRWHKKEKKQTGTEKLKENIVLNLIKYDGMKIIDED